MDNSLQRLLGCVSQTINCGLSVCPVTVRRKRGDDTGDSRASSLRWFEICHAASACRCSYYNYMMLKIHKLFLSHIWGYLCKNLVKAITKKAGWQMEIILVWSDKMYGPDNSAIIYHNCNKHVPDAAKHIGATDEHPDTCFNDLRQLQLSAMLHHSGGIDKAPHIICFDTVAMFN